MSYTSDQTDSQDYVYTPKTLYEKQIERQRQTEAFKNKWGTANQIGTATETDVIRALIGVDNKDSDSNKAGNLRTYLEEQGYDPALIASGQQTVSSDVFNPVKQTELRQIISQREQVLNAGIKLPTFDLRSITPLNAESWVSNAQKAIDTQVRSRPNGDEKTIPKIEAEKFYDPDQNMGNTGYTHGDPYGFFHVSPQRVDTVGLGLFGGGTLAILLILYFVFSKKGYGK